jgi:tRNA(Arg) A34 adenosine deaminase TadA
MTRIPPGAESCIRQCHELAIQAGTKGNHTFGALLVHKDKVILTAENTVNTENDPTRHAELNLAVKAVQNFPSAVIRNCTLYTSTAPCLMCTATIYDAGISSLVYSVSYEAFSALIPGGYKFIPCDAVYRQLDAALDLYGPILEAEGLKVFDYWPKD